MSRLEVDGLSASYGRQQVLFDVTLPPVGDGEILGILGPNASGKSTLMRCLSREKPAHGRVALDGRSQRDYGHDGWQARVAAMPQTPPAATALLPTELLWSTARAMALDVSDRELASRIELLFARLGLVGQALQPLNTLSGGKRQLVGLALALIRDPALLLLDEPTAALDLHWRMVVLDLVRDRIRRIGGLAVAALHDLNLAAHYCDRLAVLEHGRVVAAGTPRDVLTPGLLAEVYHVEAEIGWGALGVPEVRLLRPIHADDSGSHR